FEIDADVRGEEWNTGAADLAQAVAEAGVAGQAGAVAVAVLTVDTVAADAPARRDDLHAIGRQHAHAAHRDIADTHTQVCGHGVAGLETRAVDRDGRPAVDRTPARRQPIEANRVVDHQAAGERRALPDAVLVDEQRDVVLARDL